MTDTLQPAVRDDAGRAGARSISGVEQRRVLRTPMPGPRSQELHARKTAAVAAGVGTTLPVYVVRRRRRHPRGRRRQPAHRLRLRHRGDHGRQRRAARRRGGAASRSTASPTPASWSRPTRATWRSARRSTGSRPATTRSGRRCSTPARRPSRTPSRSPAAYTGRDAVAVFDHAYHGRTNLTMAMTAKNMPYKDGFGPFAGEIYRVPMSYPFREPAPIDGAEAPRERAITIAREAGRRGPTGRRRDRADPGRGRVRRAGAGLPAGARRVVPANGVVFVADEIQTGFARTGDLFACDHEGVVPDLITTAKGIAGGLPLAGRHRPRRDHGRGPRRRPRRHLRRQPGRLRRRARRDRDDRAGRPAGAGPAHRGRHAAAAARAGRSSTRRSATSAAAARCWRSRSCSPGTTDARRRRDRRGSARPATQPGW